MDRFDRLLRAGCMTYRLPRAPEKANMAPSIARLGKNLGEKWMPFGLRFASARQPISVAPVYIEIEGPGFHDVVPLPPAGTLDERAYTTAVGTRFTIALRFHAGIDSVRIRADNLDDNDILHVIAEHQQPSGKAAGVRFVGALWHDAPRTQADPDHCTITCEADGQTADCCILCTDGSTTAKICC
jgi:hypothetical protein